MSDKPSMSQRMLLEANAKNGALLARVEKAEARVRELEDAVRLIDIIEPGFADYANNAGFKYAWPPSVIDAIKAIGKMKAARRAIEEAKT